MKDESTPDDRVKRLAVLHEQLDNNPYNLDTYIQIASVYNDLAFPDLAAGATYKALLLLDACQDESDDYHEDALEALLTASLERSSLSGEATSVSQSKGIVTDENKPAMTGSTEEQDKRLESLPIAHYSRLM